MTTAQNLYITALIKQAEIASRQSKTLAFDPQGRVLIDVSLSPIQLYTLMREINQQQGSDYSLNEEGLAEALGRTPSPTTTVSLDISDIADLNARFNEQVNSAIQQKFKEKRLSIIPLQQEFYFHLALVGRLYKQLKPELTNEQISAAHQQAMFALNQQIMNLFHGAVIKATSMDNEIDYSLLNKALDKARATLMPQAHQLFMHELVRYSGVIFSKGELKKAGGHSLKQLAEATTATANDLLHTDTLHGLATLITGSENTAHNRTAGANFAHREIITKCFVPDEDNRVIAPQYPRIQIRTPSPVLKKGLTDDSAYAADVAIKLETITQHYQLSSRLEQQSDKRRAFIYNSYTAINDSLGDTGGNLQTQSARHILQGVHIYNTRALSEPEGIICLVQNISVNGFGDSLGYGSNSLQQESTLMAELALLHTLHDELLPEERQCINDVLSHYNDYLQDPSRPEYFSQSAGGNEAMCAIDRLKKAWQTQLPPHEDELFINAKRALKTLIAYDLHFNHDYSKLIQTLSVFVEQASIGGCKSGNERAQAINGRVALLDSPTREITDALRAVAQQQLEAVPQLNLALNQAYNNHGLHGAASLISLVDQGASAKVEAKPKHSFYISRNYAEESESVISYLHQTKAGAMQAHKGLTKQMKAAWEGHPYSWWSRMTSSPLGIIGAVLAIITVIPALAVALYSAVDNAQRKAYTQTTNQGLQQEYLSQYQEDVNGSIHLMGQLGGHAPTLTSVPSTSFLGSSLASTSCLTNSMHSINLSRDSNSPDETPRNRML